MKAIEKSESGKRSEKGDKMTEKTKREKIDEAFVHFSSSCVDNPGEYHFY